MNSIKWNLHMHIDGENLIEKLPRHHQATFRVRILEIMTDLQHDALEKIIELENQIDRQMSAQEAVKDG